MPWRRRTSAGSAHLPPDSSKACRIVRKPSCRPPVGERGGSPEGKAPAPARKAACGRCCSDAPARPNHQHRPRTEDLGFLLGLCPERLGKVTTDYEPVEERAADRERDEVVER